MRKQSPKELRWTVFQFRKTLVSLGWVYAPNEEIALERAAEECGVRPFMRNRLMVVREPRAP